MIFWLAFLICSAGVAGLFYLDRDKSVRNSRALWLPVIWLWIAGCDQSPHGSGWEEASPQALSPQHSTGVPWTPLFFEALIVAGIIVLSQRRTKTTALLKASGPVVLYFLYCLISTAWSPIHGPAFKRSIKDVGDLVMVFADRDRCPADCGAPASLLSGRLYFITLFNRIDPVYRFGPWVHS